MRLSAASPCLRDRKPWPPPNVKPVTPTVALVPETGARPNGAAASITSPQVAPGPTRAIRRSGSTSTELMPEVSISSVSGDGSASVPWPVARTATRRPRARAASTARRTSAGVAA